MSTGKDLRDDLLVSLEYAVSRGAITEYVLASSIDSNRNVEFYLEVTYPEDNGFVTVEFRQIDIAVTFVAGVLVGINSSPIINVVVG